MIEVPHLDVDGIRQWADPEYRTPPADPARLALLWRQLVGDVVALCDHVELQAAALESLNRTYRQYESMAGERGLL